MQLSGEIQHIRLQVTHHLLVQLHFLLQLWGRDISMLPHITMPEKKWNMAQRQSHLFHTSDSALRWRFTGPSWVLHETGASQLCCSGSPRETTHWMWWTTDRHSKSARVRFFFIHIHPHICWWLNRDPKHRYRYSQWFRCFPKGGLTTHN